MPVEKTVNVIKEVPVTVEVDKIVEKIVEVPVDRLVFKEVSIRPSSWSQAKNPIIRVAMAAGAVIL